MRRFTGFALLATALACSAKEGPTEGASAPEQPAATVPAGPKETPKPSPAEPTIAPEPTAPVANDATAAAHAAVQTVLHGEALPAHENVHFTPVADPTGRALHGFHAALRNLADKPEGDRKVRVAFYGASSVAADRYTAYLRGYLQARFGDGGVGFVAVVPLWRWHRHDAVRVTASKHWRIEHGQRKEGKLDGYYGLLGASAHADHKRAKTTVTVKTSAVSSLADADSMLLQYLEQPGGGSFSLSFSGPSDVPLSAHSTQAAAFGLKTVPVELPEAFKSLTISPKGDGEVRLFGAIFERAQPGVVVDALGIGGTRSANMINWDQAMWSRALQDRAPDLYVLAYGANESVDEDEPIEVYRENLEAVLDRFAAAAPGASCLLVGPVDYPKKDEETETWGVRPRVRAIIDVQRSLAAERGCGFFDTAALTGGLGSMPAWVAAEPQLAKGDHLHLSTLGYLYFGRVLSDALMADFDGPPRAPIATP